MTINYNVTGNERKRLADYIAGFLGSDKKYLGAPSFAYMVGYIEVSRDGAITFDDRADSKEIETLLEELEREGFHAEPAVDSEDIAEDEEVSEESANAAQGETVGFTVAIPLDKVNCGNLTSILGAKGRLIKKALGIDATPIEVGTDKVSFPWFSEMPDADETAAYTHFISALCGMSVNQKRVTAREKVVDNEKYAFRCFLLRLGFIGAEYKAERKILLRNLTGSSAFKSGARKEADSDAVSE
ncbi:MAG: virulence protein [Clostridium sp.]|nr:virulence protein [Clostridium sp.]MCM1534643.1 virulence protein [Clostridium sp.]